MDSNTDSSSKTGQDGIVLFTLDGGRYALRLDAVQRVIVAAAVTPVPGTLPFVLGLVNLAGQLLPVVSLRRRLGLPDRPLRPADQFVIVHTSRFPLALMVDQVQGLSVVSAAQTVAVDQTLPEAECRVEGLAKIDGDIILLYDVEKFLTREDGDHIVQATAAVEPQPKCEPTEC